MPILVSTPIRQRSRRRGTRSGRRTRALGEEDRDNWLKTGILRILLSGDIVYDGPLILDAYHSDIADYDASMERLDRLPVNVVHGGHFPSFGRERFKAVIEDYRQGRRKAGCHLAS